MAKINKASNAAKSPLAKAGFSKVKPLKAYHKTPLKAADKNDSKIWLYGYHTVVAALQNPKRKNYCLYATKNALNKLPPLDILRKIPVEIKDIKELSMLLPQGAIHQGLALRAEKLTCQTIEDLKTARFVLALDQITDPHNVGAIMRSASAFNIDAIISLKHRSAQESPAMAKSASGALDNINHIFVSNLAQTISKLEEMGFQTIGLDSEAPMILESSLSHDKIALILGAEGCGLRQKTRKTVQIMARLDLPGTIKSLNVSNAASIALYAAYRFLQNKIKPS